MAYSQYAKTFRQGSVKVEDGTSPTALDVTINTDQGDLSWTETTNFVPQIQRGSLYKPLPGDEAPVTFSMTLVMSRLTYQSPDASPYDILTNGNGGGTYTSVGGAGEPYQVKITLTITDPFDAAVANETVVFAYCIVESVDFSEGDPNTIAISGTDWETKPTVSSS